MQAVVSKGIQALAAAGLSLVSAAALASEGGGLTSYPDGLENFLSGALPPPGVYSMVYTGLASYNKLIGPDGNQFGPNDFNVKVGVVAPRLIWITRQTLFGGQLAFHTVLPLLNVDVTAGGKRFQKGGLADITVGTALAYHASPSMHYAVGLDITAPTGSYDKANPASVGRNVWVYTPLVAMSYIQPQGLNADLKLMYDFNTRNSDTDTRSGQAIHGDFGLGWGIGNGLVLGAGGYFFRQVTDDHGPNSAAGKARAFALGPTLKYDSGKGFAITAKLQQEFGVRNRPKGTQLFVKAILPF
jgi:hypothetical protein